MDMKVARRTERIGGTTCVYWRAGRCNRNPCRFLHRETPFPSTAAAHYNNVNNNAAHRYARKRHSSPDKTLPKYNSKTALIRKSGDGTQDAESSQKPSQISICRYWMNSNCVHGDQCWNLHSWFYGDGFSTLAKLQGHKKSVTGIALPVGSDKLYSRSTGGTVQIWDCHTGQCANVISNAVKAWNIQTSSEFTLDGPKGQILAMIVGNDTLLAGAEYWVPIRDALSGHTKAVVCLAVGGNKMLYSGSKDRSIKVWDLDTLECKMTLNAHTDAVTSLICWDHYLLSGSSDCTIKVWVATEEGTLKVTYSHSVENGVVALCGMSWMTDAEAKPILFCSSRDNSVHLYELPSFSERGRLFARQEVGSIEIGPGGLFFTGGGTGLMMMWKWLEEPKVVASSSSS